MENLQQGLWQRRNIQKPIPRNFQVQKPTLAQIVSNTMLHERKHYNYRQKKHLNKKWLNLTAAITTSEKVTDFYSTLD